MTVGAEAWRWWLQVASAGVAIWACSAARAPAEQPAEPVGQSSNGSGAQPSAASASSSAPATASKPSAGKVRTLEVPDSAKVNSIKADGAHDACPANMQLVAGDYCSEVEHECKKSWYDKSNKKTICEEFAPVSKCVGTKSPKRYCIDRYSWPNVKGERPEVMNTFYQAEVKCAAVGKRLCTESEWTMACEGPEMKPFPYGYVRDVHKCNGDHPWDSPNMSKVAKRDPAELARLWRGVPNGSQPECVSDYGVADLPGNTDDVVAGETVGPGKYESVTTGGPWYKGVRNQCRPKIYTHEEGFYYYYLSFRCCAEP
ncbi:MAG TPA: SUMF1/EgtB/PvdO family nonheme iron enzyme, partial [Polyangiaceae bacterium]|nr:SUMF1/EgtB/PvdO family nonheme iron enzyme [Polyangiaceae bacterium]